MPTFRARILRANCFCERRRPSLGLLEVVIPVAVELGMVIVGCTIAIGIMDSEFVGLGITADWGNMAGWGGGVGCGGVDGKGCGIPMVSG